MSLRVCIDARLKSGGAGGVEQLMIGIASGLSKLTDGDEEFVFLGLDGNTAWLEPHLGGPCRLAVVRKASPQIGLSGLVHATKPHFSPRRLASIPGTRWLWHHVAPHLLGTHSVPVPTAPAIFNELGPDVVHFLSQGAFRTNVPSLYHPHDLQHLHYPQYFTPRQRLCREVLYRAFCEQANVVPCASSWIKRDLVRAYELDDAKVAVVALAPPLAEYPTPSAQQCAELRTQHALAESFLLYPATTWQHKNHQALLRSAALLRKERGLELQLVFPGGKTGYRKQLERLASRLGVTDLVRYVGYVSETELAALYRMCTVVGIPTRFEAASFPLWEAFLAGKPTVCAHTTSLPEQAKDAAVFFDADSVPELTDGLWRILHDTPWCQELVRRGSERVQLFRWSRTVRHFRALYRHLGGAALTAEDRSLLQQQPLM